MSEPGSPEDDDLFADAMRGVSRMEHDGPDPHRKKIKPVPLPREVQADDEDLVDKGGDVPNFFEVRKPGIQIRLFQDLQRGLIPPEASVDLHGMRVSDARGAFRRFMRQSLEGGRRSVRIVHGKGLGSEGSQSILKQRTYFWLLQMDDVLAFCSAPRWDGGTGATYVSLRRKRRLPTRSR
jgi:DNA-nicking Smr family endonuclease